MQVLTAYVRQHTPNRVEFASTPDPDIHAIMIVLRRRTRSFEHGSLSLLIWPGRTSREQSSMERTSGMRSSMERYSMERTSRTRNASPRSSCIGQVETRPLSSLPTSSPPRTGV